MSGHLLIDWMTLRVPLDGALSHQVMRKVLACLGDLCCFDSDGNLKWQKKQLDIDKLRSDSTGLFWQTQGDGKQFYLVVAGSPASLENDGINVFGNLDIRRGAQVLIRSACKVLQSVLPSFEYWQCRRLDVTGNYLLPDADTVKQALSMLSISDGGRRRASSDRNGGDSVYWNPKSDLVKGKAYHKGPQMRMLLRKGKIRIAESDLALLDKLLRLEMTKGARWFRRLEETAADGSALWHMLTADQLQNEYTDFFSKLIPGEAEIKDMDRERIVFELMQNNQITSGRAEAAFTTLRNIRADGFDVVSGYMARSTFYRHLKYLRSIGISDSDFRTAKVLPFAPVRIQLARPVAGWESLRRVA